MYRSKLLFLIALMLPLQLLSQVKLVSEEGDAVPYAHVFLDGKAYTFSDEYGEFKIDSRQKFDTLKISHLSYETRLIPFKEVSRDILITLKDKSKLLEEVAVTSKSKKRKRQILIPDKSPGSLLGSDRDLKLIYDHGLNTLDVDERSNVINISRAVYIPNDKGYENAAITKIILNSVDKEMEGDTIYIPFRVNLMTYDTVAKLPKNKIFIEDLLVGKRRGQTIEIDLSKTELVDFPKEGVCVMVSVYHTEYYKSVGFNPPAFDAANNNFTGFREYSTRRSVDNDWEEQGYSVDRIQCFNWGIEIEVP